MLVISLSQYILIVHTSIENTIKIGYLCMLNLKTKICAHNKSLLKKPIHPFEQIQNTCNCRDKPSCPLKCASDNIYQAAVAIERGKETEIRLMGDKFKSRYDNHTASFRDNRKCNATELSKYI